MVLLEGVLLTLIFVERWLQRCLTIQHHRCDQKDPQSPPPHTHSHLIIYMQPSCLHFSFIIWVSFCFYWIWMLDHCLPESTWPLSLAGSQPAMSPAAPLQQTVLCHQEELSLSCGTSKIAWLVLICFQPSVQSEGKARSLAPPPHRDTNSVNIANRGWRPWLNMRAQLPSVHLSCLSWSWMLKISSYLVCHGCSDLKWHVL